MRGDKKNKPVVMFYSLDTMDTFIQQGQITLIKTDCIKTFIILYKISAKSAY